MLGVYFIPTMNVKLLTNVFYTPKYFLIVGVLASKYVKLLNQVAAQVRLEDHYFVFFIQVEMHTVH